MVITGALDTQNHLRRNPPNETVLINCPKQQSSGVCFCAHSSHFAFAEHVLDEIRPIWDLNQISSDPSNLSLVNIRCAFSADVIRKHIEQRQTRFHLKEFRLNTVLRARSPTERAVRLNLRIVCTQKPAAAACDARGRF